VQRVPRPDDCSVAWVAEQKLILSSPLSTEAPADNRRHCSDQALDMSRHCETMQITSDNLHLSDLIQAREPMPLLDPAVRHVEALRPMRPGAVRVRGRPAAQWAGGWRVAWARHAICAPGEQFYTDTRRQCAHLSGIRSPSQGDARPETRRGALHRVWGEGRLLCIRKATATRQ
jgi:hypothetical protein